ncbi:hypothetical protein CTAYLR_010676, partial [Chrysophaeum taylorii]
MKVNVRDNTRAFLDFSFFDSVTGDAVELERFAFTVYDIDQQTDPSVQRESFCIDDDEFHYHVISDTSTLLVTEQSETCAGGEGSSVTFSSTRAGFLCDNPTSSRLGVVTCDQCQQCLDDEERLSQYFPINQADRSVLIAFIGPQTKFSIMLEVECENCNDQPSGRNFVFGGWSGLCDPPNSTLAPASQPTSFNLELKETTVFSPDGTELDFDTAGTQLTVGDELALSYTFESTVALEVETTAYLCAAGDVDNPCLQISDLIVANVTLHVDATTDSTLALNYTVEAPTLGFSEDYRIVTYIIATLTSGRRDLLVGAHESRSRRFLSSTSSSTSVSIEPGGSSDHHPFTVGFTDDFTFTRADDFAKSHGTANGDTLTRADNLA